MNPTHIELLRGEYEETDAGVKTLVSTVISKLPHPARKKYDALNWQAQAEQLEAALLTSGVDGATLSAYVNLFCAAAAATGRSWAVMTRLLNDINALLREHGLEAVNAGLAACVNTNAPSKCSVPYLKAILRASATPAPQSVPMRLAPAAQGGAPFERMMARLEGRINAPSYNTWLRPLKCGRMTKTELALIAPSDTHVDHLKQHYIPLLTAAFREIMGGIPTHLVITRQ